MNYQQISGMKTAVSQLEIPSILRFFYESETALKGMKHEGFCVCVHTRV